jgi:hypothetical protein
VGVIASYSLRDPELKIMLVYTMLFIGIMLVYTHIFDDRSMLWLVQRPHVIGIMLVYTHIFGLL